MKQTAISVGLDIGTTKIVALVGQKNEFNKVEILGVGKSKSLGVHRGVVNNITQTIQSIQQAVEDAKLNSGHEISDVVVGIAGQHIRSIQHSDYITRPNPEEVINEEDIQEFLQVHLFHIALCLLQAELFKVLYVKGKSLGAHKRGSIFQKEFVHLALQDSRCRK